MIGNPSKRRTEEITKRSDELNWRSKKWEKLMQEVESPSLALKTQMSIKLDNDDEQSLRSQLKEIITQKIESQLIVRSEKSIEEIATDDENEQDLRSRLKKGIILRTEPLSIAQTPFIEEIEPDEEETVETTEEQKKRRELIHTYLTSTMDKDKQTEQDETEMYLTTS